MLRNYIIEQARQRAKDKQRRKYTVPQPLKNPLQKNGNAGRSFIRVGAISNGFLFPAKIVSGGGRVLDNSIFKPALQERLEDFKEERKIIEDKNPNTSRRSTAKLIVFEKIILEIKDDFRSGQWGQ